MKRERVLTSEELVKIEVEETRLVMEATMQSMLQTFCKEIKSLRQEARLALRELSENRKVSGASGVFG